MGSVADHVVRNTPAAAVLVVRRAADGNGLGCVGTPQEGEALGQLIAPYGIAVNPHRDICVGAVS